MADNIQYFMTESISHSLHNFYDYLCLEKVVARIVKVVTRILPNTELSRLAALITRMEFFLTDLMQSYPQLNEVIRDILPVLDLEIVIGGTTADFRQVVSDLKLTNTHRMHPEPFDHEFMQTIATGEDPAKTTAICFVVLSNRGDNTMIRTLYRTLKKSRPEIITTTAVVTQYAEMLMTNGELKEAEMELGEVVHEFSAPYSDDEFVLVVKSLENLLLQSKYEKFRVVLIELLPTSPSLPMSSQSGWYPFYPIMGSLLLEI